MIYGSGNPSLFCCTGNPIPASLKIPNVFIMINPNLSAVSLLRIHKIYQKTNNISARLIGNVMLKMIFCSIKIAMMSIKSKRNRCSPCFTFFLLLRKATLKKICHYRIKQYYLITKRYKAMGMERGSIREHIREQQKSGGKWG